MVVAAAIGGALAGCHPTGTPALDPIYATLFGAAPTRAAARAPQGTVLWLGVLAVAMSRGWLLIPALAAFLLAFAGVLPRRPNAILGALTGALAVQVVLRWPPMAFHGATALVAVAATGPCLVGAVRTLSAPARRRVRRWTLGLDRAGHCRLDPGRRGRSAGPFRNQPGDQPRRRAHWGRSAERHHHIWRGAAPVGEYRLRIRRSGRTDSWWTAGARLVPVVSQQRQAVGQAAAVART